MNLETLLDVEDIKNSVAFNRCFVEMEKMECQIINPSGTRLIRNLPILFADHRIDLG
jgi:hypothetical protein